MFVVHANSNAVAKSTRYVLTSAYSSLFFVSSSQSIAWYTEDAPERTDPLACRYPNIRLEGKQSEGQV